jgi:hypothetical protein
VLTIIAIIIVLVLAMLVLFERERQTRAKHRSAVRAQLLRIRLAHYAPGR